MNAFQVPLRFSSGQLRKLRCCESTTTTKRPGDGAVIKEGNRKEVTSVPLSESMTGLLGWMRDAGGEKILEKAAQT